VSCSCIPSMAFSRHYPTQAKVRLEWGTQHLLRWQRTQVWSRRIHNHLDRGFRTESFLSLHKRSKATPCLFRPRYAGANLGHPSRERGLVALFHHPSRERGCVALSAYRLLWGRDWTRERNSARVFCWWKTPTIAEVTVDECCFSTPRIIMQRCLASITTPTPWGSIAS
jgi:hypothetical protein